MSIHLFPLPSNKQSRFNQCQASTDVCIDNLFDVMVKNRDFQWPLNW